MMCLAHRSLAVVASAAAMMLWMTGGFPLNAQESGAAQSQATQAQQAKPADAPASTPTDSNNTTKPAGKTARRYATHHVPAGYSKLGLTDLQKEKLYQIQADYYARIQNLRKQLDDLRSSREKEFENLRKQLDDLRSSREKEFESVLTAPQKRLLAEAEQQKKAAAEARKAAAVKAAAAEKTDN